MAGTGEWVALGCTMVLVTGLAVLLVLEQSLVLFSAKLLAVG